MSKEDLEELFEWTDPEAVEDVYKDLFHPLNAQIIVAAAKRYIPSKGQLLEVGSGIGELNSLLPDAYKNRLIQTEKSPNYLSINLTRASDTKIAGADVYQLPFSDESFSGVLMLNVLDVLSNPNQAVEEMGRVLKPGGVILHLQDSRPSLTWSVYQIDPGFIPFPLVEEGDINRLQLVKKRDAKQIRNQLDSRSRRVFDLYRQHPQLIEEILRISPESIRVLSRVTRKAIHVRKILTPTLDEMFNDKMKSTLSRAGLVNIESRSIHSQTVTTADRLPIGSRTIFPHPNYYWKNEQMIIGGGYEPDLPIGPDEVWLLGLMNVLVASKKP